MTVFRDGVSSAYMDAFSMGISGNNVKIEASQPPVLLFGHEVMFAGLNHPLRPGSVRG